MQSLDTTAKTRILPVTKWPHPWPSQNGLRHLIFNAESNGFARCVRRIGRRVLIDEAEFFKWVRDRNEALGRAQRRSRRRTIRQAPTSEG